MKRMHFTKGLPIALLSIYLIGCAENEDSSPATRQLSSASSDPEQQATPKQHLTVKGLYLGMSADEAKTVLINTHELNIAEYTEDLKITGGKMGAQVYIWFDDNREVNRIEFNERFVNKYFNVTDLDAQKFSQEFLNNYGIPSFQPLSDRQSGWNYRNDREGYEVAIYNGKNVCLRRIPKIGDRKFD